MGITSFLAKRQQSRRRRHTLVDGTKQGQSDDSYNDIQHANLPKSQPANHSATSLNHLACPPVPSNIKRVSILGSLHTWFSSLGASPTTLKTAQTTSSNGSEPSNTSIQLPLSIDLESMDTPKSWGSSKLGALTLTSEDRSVYSTGTSERMKEMVTLRLRDLKLRDSNCTETLELVLPRSASFADLSRILTEKGYESPVGIWSDYASQGLRSNISFNEPIPVNVTEGISSFDMDSGLRINKHEKFQDFLSKLQLSVRCIDSQLQINGGSLKIGFRRTLRVPHDGTHRGLPPDAGLFPMFNAAHFAEETRVGGEQCSDDRTNQEGVVVPLYQREAVWLEFEADRPYTIRVFMGGYNTISGLPRLAPKHPRRPDSLLFQGQSRITGVTLPNGKMRQLVPMPLALEDSLDGKITRRLNLTNIQLEISAAGSELGFYPGYHGSDERYAPAQTPQEVNAQPGHDLFLRPVGVSAGHPFLRDHTQSERSTLIREIFTGEVEKFMEKECVDVRALYSIRLTIKRTDTVSRPFVQDFSPFDTMAKVASEVFLNHSPLTEFVLVHNDKVLAQNETTLAELCFTGETLIHAYKDFLTKTIPSAKPTEVEEELDELSTDSEVSSQYSSTTSGGETSIANRSAHDTAHSRSNFSPAEALQRILSHESSNPAPENTSVKPISTLINVQFPNSAIFEDITGILMPPSPVTPQTYADAGLPFYTIYEEKILPVGRLLTAGGGQGAKSTKNIPLVEVNTADSSSTVKLGYEVRGDDRKCMVCQGRVVDTILRPCNHLFCYTCVSKKMTNHVIVSCAICHQIAFKVLGLSVPAAVLKGSEKGKEMGDDVIPSAAWDPERAFGPVSGRPMTGYTARPTTGYSVRPLTGYTLRPMTEYSVRSFSASAASAA